MSVLELKQEITRMNRRGREEIYAYLVRLKHETPEWKKAAASRIRAMKKGAGVTAEEMETR
jgi:hypothetical protein